MASTLTPGLGVDSGIIIRRILFFFLLVLLTITNLVVLFRGLSSPQAMDQAQIGRNIARDGTFTTKFIRPVAVWQAEKASEGAVSFENFRDTYHAPLNPLILGAVLKLVGADDPEAWQMPKDGRLYRLDRVIATVSTLFFLMAIGVNYLLVSRIFDIKIAGVTALLMLFCQLFWDYAVSGLPQMLMMLLFSCGAYFAYRATEKTVEGQVAVVPALVAGFFFVLLALAHWIGVWIVFGYAIYAAIMFTPRGLVAGLVLAMMLLAGLFPMMVADQVSGSPFGTAFLVLYNGLAGGSESFIMRLHDLDQQPLSTDGLLTKVLRTMLLQGTDILPFLGGIVAAPLFFISLLHPFKRASIAHFRWAILSMWLAAVLGMALFGVEAKGLHPNQIHLLFAPVMTAYGLAFLSILWSRLNIPKNMPVAENAHLILVILLSALPMLLALPQKVRIGMNLGEKGFPQWPPYYPPALNIHLKQLVQPDEIVVSDQPWAVAWYADRMSLWLPAKKDGFTTLERRAEELKTPFVGLLISPSSFGSKYNMREINKEYGDFASLVMDGSALRATYPPGVSLFERDSKLTDISQTYRYRAPLLGFDLIYYSKNPLLSTR
jgi:hypothetical protein